MIEWLARGSRFPVPRFWVPSSRCWFLFPVHRANQNTERGTQNGEPGTRNPKKTSWDLPPSGVNRSVNRELPEQALLQIYGDTIRPLYRFVSKRVGGDASLAEDLVQDTWMRALDSWPARGVPDEPLAWLVRVARNSLIDHFRRVTPQLVDPARLDLENAAFSPDAPDIASVVSWGLARLRRRQARSCSKRSISTAGQRARSPLN